MDENCLNSTFITLIMSMQGADKSFFLSANYMKR